MDNWNMNRPRRFTSIWEDFDIVIRFYINRITFNIELDEKKKSILVASRR